MAEERPTTPEKQLLDLIEDPKGQGVSRKKIKNKSFSLFSFSALRGRLSFFLEGVRTGSLFRGTLPDIKGLNRALKVCIVLLFLYLVGALIISFGRLKEAPKFITESSRPFKEIPVAGLLSKKVSVYLEGPRSRDIFEFGDFGLMVETVEEEEFEDGTPRRVVLSKAEILSRKLGLVGIGWSDDPDVMVENMDTTKIYFLKRGQKIEGLIKVDAIFQDRVILTYDEGKELELR